MFPGNFCPAGAYCPTGSGAPKYCPPGTYLNTTRNTNESDCMECDPGHYCAGYGNSEPTGVKVLPKSDIINKVFIES